MKARTALGLALLLTAACSSSGSGPPDGAADGRGADAGAVPLCDGVGHLRLWALVSSGGQEWLASRVETENGYAFLAVDGHCTYWMNGGWIEDPLARDRPIVTGQLTGEQAAFLAAKVPLDDVMSLVDCSPGSYPDAGSRQIRTSGAQASCSMAGTRFDAAWAGIQSLAGDLLATGTPATGALHVSARSVALASATPPAYSWPVATPLSAFILAGLDLDRTGVSRRVDDPEIARALRAVRDQYLRDRGARPGLYSSWEGLAVTDQTTTAFLYMRDATPYEADDGLLTF